MQKLTRALGVAGLLLSLTLGSAVAAQAADRPDSWVTLKTKLALMTTEGIDEPLQALEDARRARDIPPAKFRTLGFGEFVRVG